ncbi:hypothetical protein ACLOJK_020762 [Asimina triloba]
MRLTTCSSKAAFVCYAGIEVKAGETVKCEPGMDKYLHLSQASLGEVKKDKGDDSVVISVKVDDKKLVLGTLSSEKYSDSESDEEIPQLIENGKPEVKEDKSKTCTEKSKPKPDSLDSKPKAKLFKPNQAIKPEEEDEDDEDESGGDESDDEDMVDGEDSEDGEDEDSSEEEEAMPKKGKKRPAETETKTPAAGKKAKLAVPGEKTGANVKKGSQTATPAKHGGKTPGSNEKQQTPKSGGQVSCKSCSKKFNSDVAMQAHTKAKHSAGK